MNRDRSETAFRRAAAVSPGGVHSPVRAFKAVGGTPVVMARAQGSRIIDIDDNEYVDLCMSWGPLVLGHAHPSVVQAVQEAAASGLSFGACHEGEAELSEAILGGYPDFHRVRLTSSGTEAVMTALRIARAATNRSLTIKFEGGYHGHSDSLLVQAGSGLATLGTPTSAGIPEAVAATTLVAPLDDLAAAEHLFERHGPDIACVIVEPIPANNGLLLPSPSFLPGLRRLCDAAGALLIFDEVISGFRFRYGGVAPLVGAHPDMVTLGKIVGGGMPIGAVTGPSSLLDRLAPTGPVYQAGTLSGNPVSVAAGIATLAQLRDGLAYAGLERLGARLEAALRGGPSWLRLRRMGSVAWPYFSDGEMSSRADGVAPEAVRRFNAMHGAMLDRGIYLPPSALEVWFLSLAHSDEDVDRVADALLAEAAALDVLERDRKT
jgi:glutamate-1-semialdehyde 2,1-aminomutase